MIGPRATVKDQVDLSSQPALAADIEIEADSACRPETAYEGLGVPDVTVTVTDNDVPGVTVNRVSVTVTEGRATDTYTVVLTTQPSSSATVTVDDSAADVSATPTTLTFTASKLRCSRRPGHGPPRPSPGNASSGGRAAECNRAVRDAAARVVGIVREAWASVTSIFWPPPASVPSLRRRLSGVSTARSAVLLWTPPLPSPIGPDPRLRRGPSETHGVPVFVRTDDDARPRKKISISDPPLQYGRLRLWRGLPGPVWAGSPDTASLRFLRIRWAGTRTGCPKPRTTSTGGAGPSHNRYG